MTTPDADVRIGIFGRGRLGDAIATAAAEVPDARRVQVAWTVGRKDPVPEAAVDVAIDASVAAAVDEHLDWALAAGVPLVIGVTGWPSAGLQDRVGDRGAAMLAPNFSVGAALLRRFALVLGRFADRYPEFDPYVTDHHHRHKRDAPSGTARVLAESVLEGCGRKSEWTLVSGPVAEHQLSVSAVRAGAEFGSHAVGVDAPGEVVEVRHRARSRAAFGVGALEAARWIRGRSGVFTFDDVVADLLDPLFDLGTRSER